MKLSISQALATVLNIQVVPFENPDTLKVEGHFICGSQVQISLGRVNSTTLEQAVCKAVIECDLKAPSGFAIFPIGSDRENIYMAIERELLRQEQALGQQMWNQLGNDPRELVTLIMEQLRECASSVVNPPLFQIALLRVCCLCIACMTWVSDWLTRLKIRASVLQQQREQQKIPPVIPTEKSEDYHNPKEPPTPPLFGAGGPGAIKIMPDPELVKAKQKICPKQHQLTEDDICPVCGEMTTFVSE